MWDCNTQKKKKKKKVRYLSKSFFGVNFVINIIKRVYALSTLGGLVDAMYMFPL